MSTPLQTVAAALCGLFLGLPGAHADDASPIHMFITLGSSANQNDLSVSPPELTLKAGEVYQLVVSNPSEISHVVAAPEFAATVKTTRLTIGYPASDLPAAEISSGISLQPGHVVEWTFTPAKEGTYKFGCNKLPHAAAGMHTTIAVVRDML